MPSLKAHTFHAVLSVVLVAAWALPTSVRAHGTGSRWLPGERTLTVYFHYSTGEPMSWVKVRVFGPTDAKTEFVIARTDRNGRFAFLPDTPGRWTVEALDEDGHRAVAEADYEPVRAPAGEAGTKTPAVRDTGDGPVARPVVWRALLGVSLILNVFFGAALALRRKSGGV